MLVVAAVFLVVAVGFAVVVVVVVAVEVVVVVLVVVVGFGGLANVDLLNSGLFLFVCFFMKMGFVKIFFLHFAHFSGCVQLPSSKTL